MSAPSEPKPFTPPTVVMSEAVKEDLQDAIEAKDAREHAESAAKAAAEVHERELQEAATTLYKEYGGKESIFFTTDYRRQDHR